MAANSITGRISLRARLVASHRRVDEAQTILTRLDQLDALAQGVDADISVAVASKRQAVERELVAARDAQAATDVQLGLVAARLTELA